MALDELQALGQRLRNHRSRVPPTRPSSGATDSSLIEGTTIPKDLCSFLFASARIDEDDMAESYVRVFESQVEEVCKPLAVTGLNSAEAGSIADKIWFDTDLTSVDLIAAIDILDRLTMISDGLELARHNIERAF